MTHPVRFAALRAACGASAMAFALAGCSAPSSTPPAGSTTAPVSVDATPSVAASTPTPSPTPAYARNSPEAIVLQLHDTMDRLGNDPELALDEVDEFASGREREMQKSYLQRDRSEGVRQVGYGVVDILGTELVDGSKVVTACVDYTDVEFLGPDGASVLTDDNPRRMENRFTVGTFVDGVFVVDRQTSGPCTTDAPARGADSAEAAVLGLVDAVDRTLADQTVPTSELSRFATGVALTEHQADTALVRKNGYFQVGTRTVEVSATQETPAGTRVTACLDATESDLVDRTRTSQVHPDAARRTEHTYRAVQQDGRWLVSEHEHVGECAA